MRVKHKGPLNFIFWHKAKCTFIDNKSSKGSNVCAMIGVKGYGGWLKVCQRLSDEDKLGAISGDNRGIPK